MKYIMRGVLSAFLLLPFVQNANAADANHSYVILGPGSYSCQRIISDMAQDAKKNDASSIIIYSNWLAGNLTAYNRETKGTYSILGDSPFTEAFTWAVQYCQDHPDKIFSSAADALIVKLKPHRYTTMPRKNEETEDKDDKDDNDDDDNEKSDMK